MLLKIIVRKLIVPYIKRNYANLLTQGILKVIWISNSEMAKGLYIGE